MSANSSAAVRADKAVRAPFHRLLEASTRDSEIVEASHKPLTGAPTFLSAFGLRTESRRSFHWSPSAIERAKPATSRRSAARSPMLDQLAERVLVAPATRIIRRSLTIAAVLVAASFTTAPAAPQPVTVSEDARTFTLDNGILQARIEKRSGVLTSLHYKNLEMLAQESPGGALGGYWSSVGRIRPGSERDAVVRIDPAKNGGERAEISCESHNDPDSPSSPLDMDIRYSLGRGESWLYAYSVWSHKPGYPPFGVGEARYAAKLNPEVFDYMSIDKDRQREMPTPEDWDRGAPLNLKEARRMTTGIHKGEVEHKYDYSALIYEIPAYGWSSSADHVGFWFVNPSFEYMAGGPTKVELTGHLDVNPGGTPTLLNMWLGSHYGGSSLAVAQDEDWTKVIGPFLIYCNSGLSHKAMWRLALAQAKRESKRWPYAWVDDPNYVPAAKRSVVTGRIVVHDPYDPKLQISNLWVGVTAPDYTNPPRRFEFRRRSPRADTNATDSVDNSTRTNRAGRGFAGGFNRNGFPPEVSWQRDAKHYQFWVRADDTGRFSIPNVRPGRYWLHAIADGVIGEFHHTNVVVQPGSREALGKLTWTPKRYGRTVWQIGVPDRTAREYRHGDHYWQWGLYYDYPKEFPNDVHFVIGKSNWHTDWNYVQPPRIEDPNAPAVGEEDEADDAEPIPEFRRGRREVSSTTWTIQFGMEEKPRGEATLRLAFCGTHRGCHVEVFVNDESIGDTGFLPSTSAMQRDGIQAYWIEKPMSFDATLLRKGQNVIKLLSHANSWNQGVMYDCVRLELNDGAVTSAAR